MTTVSKGVILKDHTCVFFLHVYKHVGTFWMHFPSSISWLKVMIMIDFTDYSVCRIYTRLSSLAMRCTTQTVKTLEGLFNFIFKKIHPNVLHVTLVWARESKLANLHYKLEVRSLKEVRI